MKSTKCIHTSSLFLQDICIHLQVHMALQPNINLFECNTGNSFKSHVLSVGMNLLHYINMWFTGMVSPVFLVQSQQHSLYSSCDSNYKQITHYNTNKYYEETQAFKD